MGKIKSLFIKMKKVINKEGFKKSLVASALSLCILFTSSCSTKTAKNNKVDYIPATSRSTSVDDSQSKDSITEYKIPEMEVAPATEKFIPIHIAGEGSDEFNEYLNNYSVEYPYEELFGIEESLLVEVNRPSINKHEKDVTNGTGYVDAELLLNAVKENNGPYLEAKPYAMIAEMPDDKLVEVVGMLTNCINDVLEKNPNIDKEMLFCFLSDLKIFDEFTINFAAVTDDGALKISSNMIELGEIFYKEDNLETKVLIHEIMHMAQSFCNCYDDNMYQVGISKRYDELEINPQQWLWFVEASAERLMANSLNTNTDTYGPAIEYMDTLVYPFLLDDSIKINEFKEITITKDVDKFLSFFNVKTEEEKIQFMKLMYSIQVIQFFPEDFVNKYEDANGKLPESEEEKISVMRVIRNDMRKSLCSQLTLDFYKNLTSTTKGKDLQIQDIFYLIRGFETRLNIHLEYNEEDGMAIFTDFLHFYAETQDEFFKYLALNIDYNETEIREMYNDYFILKESETSQSDNKLENVTLNRSLAYLPTDTLDYLDTAFYRKIDLHGNLYLFALETGYTSEATKVLAVN